MEKTNLIGVREACEMLGISRSWLYQLMCKRKVPYYKPSGKLAYFDRAELEAWVTSHRITA